LSSDLPPPPKYLQIARVLRPHGVRGDLRIQVITSFPDRMNERPNVFIGPAPDSYRATREGLKAFRITRAHRDKGDQWLIHLSGIDDRDAAEAFRTMSVFVPIEDATPLQDGEFYLFQLMGLAVVSTDGKALGTLTQVLETGANDVLVVKGEVYGEVLLPLIDGVIQQVDLPGRTITVHLLDGLLPDESTPDEVEP
jgi:16S rRNA processing protein RimM